MLKGFKDFIMRGNVVDLAVGVVIGAAFTTLVTGFTDSFLKPLINMAGANSVSKGGQWDLPGQDNAITWGAFLGTLISFLLTAAVVYFLVVLPMNKIAERRNRDAVTPPAVTPEEVKLLREIRDALVAGQTPSSSPAPHPRPGESAEQGGKV